jgi:hypothetical protein
VFVLVRNRAPLQLVVALSLFVPLAGCFPVSAKWLESETNFVDLHYTPDREKTSPLGRLPPLKIALEVRDRRVVSEQDRVGNGQTSYDTLKLRGSPAKVISQDPVIILSNAMTIALRDNGHTVVQARDLTEGVIIQAHLKRFWSSIIEQMDYGTIMESAFAMDIEVLTKPDNNWILSKPIRTIYRRTFFVCGLLSNCYADTLNEGLSRFMASFSADPEVLEALRSTSPKAGS